jgi:ribonuclease VapC
MSSVNYGEVYCIVLRECGKEKVDEIENAINTLPVKIIDVDIELAKIAASFKATKKISYADCFTAALARLHNGEIITGDKEFKILESDVRISWL